MLLEDALHDIARVGRQVCDFVGVEVLRRREQLVAVHLRNKRFAHRVGKLEEYLAFPVGLDEIPNSEPLL